MRFTGENKQLKKAKEEFNKIQLELADLSTKFSNNVLDATKAFSLTLTDKADVEGLPASALGLAAQSAKVSYLARTQPMRVRRSMSLGGGGGFRRACAISRLRWG